jgi:hypothetical protein
VNYTRDVRLLRLHALTVQIASVLVSMFGLLALYLYISPALVGDPLGLNRYSRSEPVWLIIGIGFIVFGIFCGVWSTRWSRRLLWIWKNVSPQSMQLSVLVEKWTDSTDYRAVLRADSNSEEVWRVSLYGPSWNVEELQRTTASAKVYFDPKSKRPAVIETEWGLLWAMAGRSAVETNV